MNSKSKKKFMSAVKESTLEKVCSMRKPVSGEFHRCNGVLRRAISYEELSREQLESSRNFVPKPVHLMSRSTKYRHIKNGEIDKSVI